MTDIGESISIPEVDGPWKCPFDHKGKEEKKENVLPPPDTQNNATKLASNLGEGQDFEVTIGGKRYDAKLAAHHILPGNESWPKSDLHKWVNKKKKNHVKGDIGYDVNDAANGVNLADDQHYPGGSMNKEDYAYALMKAKRRQFHDRHPAYSEWVINRLNKIAARLEKEVSSRGGKGCGKANCPLETSPKKPYDPPYNLLGRLYGMASSLKPFLLGSPKRWRMPLMTSRFSAMYKLHVSEEEAKQRLAAARATMKTARGG